MDEITARSAAKRLTEALTRPMQVFSLEGGPEILTIVDIMRMGCMMFHSAKFAMTPDRHKLAINEAFLSNLLGAFHDPKGLEDFLCDRISQGLETPSGIEHGIHEVEHLLRSPKSLRSILSAVVNEAIPAGQPGRSTKLTQNDYGNFLNQIEELIPSCQKIVNLKNEYPTKDWHIILDFVSEDCPQDVQRLSRALKVLEDSYSDERFLSQTKRLSTRARKLAEAVVGYEWNISPNYARQIGSIARRYLNRKRKLSENWTISDNPIAKI
jgi:hypothetical protein